MRKKVHTDLELWEQVEEILDHNAPLVCVVVYQDKDKKFQFQQIDTGSKVILVAGHGAFKLYTEK